MSHDDIPAMGHGFEPGSAEKGFQYKFIYYAIFATIAVCIFFALAVWPLVQGIVYMDDRGTDGSALEAQQQGLRPTGPLLQADPSKDMDRLLARDQQSLNSYGWVDQATGRARVPLEIARERVLNEGLPEAAYAFQNFPEATVHSETYPEDVSPDPPVFEINPTPDLPEGHH